MKNFRIYDIDGTTTIVTANSYSEASKEAISQGYNPSKIVEL